jgi:hypothetical protein
MPQAGSGRFPRYETLRRGAAGVHSLFAAPKPAPSPPALAVRAAHVIVALADNRHQGIVPVPAAVGSGDDPGRSLYWGAACGVKTFFRKSAEWRLAFPCAPGKDPVLERCVFRHTRDNVYIAAEAYRGRDIKRAISDFFDFAAGHRPENAKIGAAEPVPAAGASALVAYVGHGGLMDFALDRHAYSADNRRRDVMILARASKSYFADALRWTGARPLLWTTGLMAPEAYVLEAALAGWTRDESGEQIRARAAQTYDRYRHCGPKAAHRLFASGW